MEIRETARLRMDADRSSDSSRNVPPSALRRRPRVAGFGSGVARVSDLVLPAIAFFSAEPMVRSS